MTSGKPRKVVTDTESEEGRGRTFVVLVMLCLVLMKSFASRRQWIKSLFTPLPGPVVAEYMPIFAASVEGISDNQLQSAQAMRS